MVKPMIETVESVRLEITFFTSIRKTLGDSSITIKTDSLRKPLKMEEPSWRTKATVYISRYDDIPWNKIMQNMLWKHSLCCGATSPVFLRKGYRDYLILLSVCETCRIGGLSFLEFLRSVRGYRTYKNRLARVLPKSMQAQGHLAVAYSYRIGVREGFPDRVE